MRDNNISPLREFFHNKYILAFLAIDLIAIAALVGVFINRSTRISTINFNVVPANATISVDGDKRYKNGQYDIAPGAYKIEISHDGLETKTLTVDIDPRNYAAVTVFLTDSDKSFDYYKQNDHYEPFKSLQSIASAENNIITGKDTSAQEFITNYDKTLSIFSKLPIKGYEDEVIKKIEKAGYDPGDYQIIYTKGALNDSNNNQIKGPSFCSFHFRAFRLFFILSKLVFCKGRATGYHWAAAGYVRRK